MSIEDRAGLFTSDHAGELVNSLLRHDGTEPLPILSSLVDAVSERDRGLLDELERLVKAKRDEIDRESSK